MSTNSECTFIQVTVDKWYYLLEDYNAPKNSFDWREHASSYGPFPNEEVAHEHLDNNHANPGGYGTCKLSQGQVSVDLEKDPTLKRLIESAQPPRSRSQRYRW